MILGKKGQLAIFVIVAIVIIGIVLAVILYPKINLSGSESEAIGPEGYLKSCMEPIIKPNLEKIASQGGYSEPVGFIVYNGSKVPYLCYTSEYYKTCVVQQPNIGGQFEKELNKVLKREAEDCVKSFKSEYERKGYSVSISKVEVNSTFDLGKMNVEILAPMTVTKEVSRNYNRINLEFPSEMYELIQLSTSIVEFESTYGDSETTLYMRYYPNIKVEKTKLSDGSKIYIVSDVVSKEKFQFASRSLSWPPGYSLT